jgi:molybdopterin/thiamine biosynthesis adenylyltransferase
MPTYKDSMFKRNYGFFSEEEQKKIIDSTVAIAGVGGDGFQLGEKLARIGVSKFIVADPEVFEAENINRVSGAKNSTLGKNKAEVFRDSIADIHPDAEVEIYTEGVNEDNVHEIVSRADLILDESELTRLELGTMIARESRKNNKPVLVVLNIGFAAIATSFDPNGRMTFEKTMGIPKDMPIDEVAEMEVDFSRCLPYMPQYGDINSLISAQKGYPLPSISQGVDVASALGSTEAFLHLTKGVANHRKSPTFAPSWRYMDAYSGESGTIRMARISHYMGLFAILGRMQLGLNPRASYKEDDIKNRET